MEDKTELKKLRENKGETISGMARRLKIGISRYYMIESGDRPATPEIADGIIEILGGKMEDIFMPQSFTVRKSNNIYTDQAATLDHTGTEGSE